MEVAVMFLKSLRAKRTFCLSDARRQTNETSLAESLIPMTVDWRNVGRVPTELSAKGRRDREKDSLLAQRKGTALSLIVVINVRCVAEIT